MRTFLKYKVPMSDPQDKDILRTVYIHSNEVYPVEIDRKTFISSFGMQADE